MKGLAKVLTKKKLTEIFKKVPAPIQEHLKRCKKLAKFFVERLCMEDWYLDLKLNENDLILACSYHDIGKMNIPRDVYYYKHCTTADMKDSYKEHVSRGIDVLLTEFPSVSEEDLTKARGFPKMLYQSIVHHHEHFDGKGFPQKLVGEDISFVGRFVSVVDTWDNLLFVGADQKIDFDKALAEMQKLAGNVLDDTLVNVFLKDPDALRNFCDDMLSKQKNAHRGNNRYGMHVLYAPIVSLNTNEPAAFMTDLVINDPYYGIVSSKIFLPVAEKEKQIRTVDKLYLEKVFRTLMRAKYKGVFLRNVFVNLSMELLSMKTFFPFLQDLVKKYLVSPHQVVICIEESDLHQTNVELKPLCDQIHLMGMRFGVSSFGEESSLVSVLSEVPMDYVIFSRKVTNKMYLDRKTYEVVSGLAKIPLALDIRVVFDGIKDESQTTRVLAIGAKHVMGPLYGEYMHTDELMKRLEPL